LADVFGFNGSMGWGLKILHRTQHPLDFEAVSQFLSPNGTIFALIEKLQRDPDVCFEFPVSCLPMATQQQLASGAVPVLYQQKLRRPQSQIVETESTVIWLNAFEYYMFHFAYWLVVWAGKPEPPWTDLANSLYLSVLDSYCKALLPVQGNINIGSNSTTQISPPRIQTAQSSQPIRSRNYWSSEAALLSWNGLTPPYDYKPVPGLLKPSAVTSPLSGLNSSRGSYMNETWCSETFAKILVEFWLNQVPVEQSAGISFVNVRQAAMPCQEHVKLVRVLIKHVHYFVAAANRHASHSLATLQLRRTIVPDIFQKKLFNFLHHAFTHWPLDSTFRVVRLLEEH
jgi:sphingomyelin phosphodiesterase 4